MTTDPLQTEATDGPWMAIENTVATIIQDVCELPGDAADDDPDRLVCTVDELRIIVERALEGALPPPPPSVVQELVEALTAARKIIAEIDEYMKRPECGDYGVECALCMGELLDDDRQAIAKIDALLTRVKGGD